MYIEVGGRKISRLYGGLNVYHYLYSEKGRQENFKVKYLAEVAYGKLRCCILLGHNNGRVDQIFLCGDKEFGRYGPVGDLVQTVEIDMSNVIVAMISFENFGSYAQNSMKFKTKFEKELNLYNKTTENSLMNMCRKVVRQQLSRIDTLYDFDMLPLPSALKRYLHCYRGRWCNKGCDYCLFSLLTTINQRKL